MYSKSLPNLEFVLVETKTPRVLLKVLSSDDVNPIITLTAEGVSNALFFTYILSSIYLLYIFQRVITRRHKLFFNRSPTLIFIALIRINHKAIYLHCLLDNLLRYIFNTLLGLPYGFSFFYPAPQSPLEIFPRWIFPNPTSEGLDFWTKLILLLGSELGVLATVKCINPWYEARQRRKHILQQALTDKKSQFQARVNQVSIIYGHNSLAVNRSRFQNLQVKNRGDGEKIEAGVDGNQAPTSNTSNVVEDLERIISKTETSHVSSVHDLEILWSLLEGNKWGFDMERISGQAHSDEVSEECKILEDSAVLVHQNEVNTMD
ncbi:hypothetical protein OCU04_003448 [Sclerotinia nivalis]|uniref:Uncharacterized protein n=1 Tax=Sclerotinia nivalis TaxID=352851 RepID=A0A9X0AVF4_9HELO|nr:hypothetical protein OCU04_003448 [Sclerotinia nivalis]